MRSFIKLHLNRFLKRFFNLKISGYIPGEDNFKWISNRGISTVIDIGANKGLFAKHMRNILPKATIFSFEPIPQVFDQLKENTFDINVNCLPFALGTKNQKLEMFVNDYSPSSSILSLADEHLSNFKKARNTHKEIIQMKRLDDFTEEIPLVKPILLKIDVQGFEDQVIEGGTSVIEMCEMIIIEVSFVTLYEGQKLFGSIYNQLKNLDFEYHGTRGLRYRNSDGGILYGDATFIKRSF